MLNDSCLSKLTSIQILKKIGENITPKDSNKNISNQIKIPEPFTNRLSTFQSEEQPLLIHLAGIPGAGKSTYAKKLVSEPELHLKNKKKLLKQPLFHISFDEIMESLSGYQDSVKICAKKAFNEWETHAKQIGYKLLVCALKKKTSIVLDHSAANPEHLALLQALRRENLYRLEMHLVKASPEQVLARVKKREQLTQRHTPENLIFTRHKLLEELIPEYQKNVHHFVEIDSH